MPPHLLIGPESDLEDLDPLAALHVGVVNGVQHRRGLMEEDAVRVEGHSGPREALEFQTLNLASTKDMSSVQWLITQGLWDTKIMGLVTSEMSSKYNGLSHKAYGTRR